MSANLIVDTFPAFLKFWEKVRGRSRDEQVEGWASTYLASWPELLKMQVQDYVRRGQDWRQIAGERVIAHWTERLPAMQRAHANLLQVCADFIHSSFDPTCSLGPLLAFNVYAIDHCHLLKLRKKF